MVDSATLKTWSIPIMCGFVCVDSRALKCFKGGDQSSSAVVAFASFLFSNKCARMGSKQHRFSLLFL